MSRCNSKWRCVVDGCGDVVEVGSEQVRRFFPFPQPTTVARSVWLSNVNLGPHFKPGRFDAVCSKHFVDGHPTSRNPYPEIDMGWECPKREIAPTNQLDALNRPTAAEMAAKAARAKNERFEARRLLGMPEELTDEEKAIRALPKPTSSYLDYCSVVGCPNCCYVLKKMGLRCEAKLFPIPKNEPNLADQWSNFARLSTKYAKLRGQICALHFIDGEPTKENPYPTIYPKLESYPSLVSRSKSEKTTQNCPKIEPEIIKNDKNQVKNEQNQTKNEQNQLKNDKNQVRNCKRTLDFLDSMQICPPKLERMDQKIDKCDQKIDKSIQHNPPLSIRLKIFLTNEQHCQDLIGISPKIFEILNLFLKDKQIDFKKKCYTSLESSQLSLGACLIGTLMKIKLLISDELLANLFSVHVQQLRQTLNKFIEQLSFYVGNLIFWPENFSALSKQLDNQSVYGILDCITLDSNRGHVTASNNNVTCSSSHVISDQPNKKFGKFVVVYSLKGAVIFRSQIFDSGLDERFIVEKVFNENLHKFLSLDDQILLIFNRNLLLANCKQLKLPSNLHILQQLEQKFGERLKNFAFFNVPYDNENLKPYENVYDSMVTIGCFLLSLMPEVDFDWL